MHFGFDFCLIIWDTKWIASQTCLAGLGCGRHVEAVVLYNKLHLPFESDEIKFLHDKFDYNTVNTILWKNKKAILGQR